MASTSAPSIRKSFRYDVFLSFRGEDTRKNFVDHLYHALNQKGIMTYKDDERIEKGERISEQLIRSIADCRFYIIVFSKNYASSSWCLDELVQIMECQKMAEHTAYPVFYDVEPTEVRHQSGAVEEAFAKLVAKNEGKRKRMLEDVDQEKEEDLGRWRNALKDAAALAGWEMYSDGPEGKLVQQIAQEILQKLCFNETLVGMETRLKDVVGSLENGFNDVRIIGIKGMKGSGKTALARAVFGYLSFSFEGVSFVENVSEVSNGLDLRKLQNQILSDVLDDQSIVVQNVSNGKNMMKKMMPSRKVLLVLDDVSERDQLEALAGELTWFKPGSRIIITTRDEQVLLEHQVKFIHDVELLSDEEAIFLFSSYAFGRGSPAHGYEELSREVVRYADGLPLTIKVWGSHLGGKSMHDWVDAIETLKSLSIKRSVEENLIKPCLNVDGKLVGMETRVKKMVLSLQNSFDDVRIIGIKGMEGSGKTALAKAIFDDISNHFEGKSFVTSVSGVSNGLDLRKLQTQILSDVLDDPSIVVQNISDGKNMMKRMMRSRKVLLVLDDVSEIEQLRALAGEPNWFKTGSTIIITTRDEQVLLEHRVKCIHEVDLLSNEEAILLFCRNAFGGEILVQGYEELSKKVVHCAAGNPLIINVLGSFLCGKTKQEWGDTLERLKSMSLKETLELQYIGLEDRKVFLDGSCILKGQNKYLAMRISQICGVDAQIGPIVLKQIPSIMHPDADRFHVHDYIEKVDRYFDRFLPPDLHKERNILRITDQKSKDTLVNALSMEEWDDTDVRSNKRLIALKNVKEVRLLGVNDAQVKWNFDEVDQYLHNSLRSLNWCHYPFRCLPETFQANNLINLELRGSNIIELWEGGDKKVLENLRFLDLSNSKLRTFDLGMTPNLETLLLEKCFDFEELQMACECPKLKFLNFTASKLSNLDLRLIPNLEGLYLEECNEFLELQMPVKPPKLKLLEVSGSKLSHLWLTSLLEKLENLEDLTLSIKEIEHLPDSILMLKHLKYLKLKSCLLLKMLPHNLDRLVCLEGLYLTDCTSLPGIPNSICKMKRLRHVHLPHCILVQKLPEELRRLECLKELHIEGTRIRHLPQSILKLKGVCIVWSKGKLESYGFKNLKEISKYTASYCV